MVAVLEYSDDVILPNGAPAPLLRIKRDILSAAKLISDDEARFLVDTYYQVQQFRISSAAQVRQLNESGEPNDFLSWTFDTFEYTEKQIKNALAKYTDQHTIGQWAKSIPGIGPVLAAGLSAYIDIERAPTAGAIWRYAGLDATSKWHGREATNELIKTAFDVESDQVAAMLWLSEAFAMRPLDVFAAAGVDVSIGAAHIVRAISDHQGDHSEIVALTEREIATHIHLDHAIASICEYRNFSRWLLYYELFADTQIDKAKLRKALARRPWNADLKRLCWLIGESFVKVQANERDVYGKVYVQRKAQEIEKNDRLEFADQAAEILKKKKIGKDTDAYKAYSQGKLPPAHLHSRAKRYAVKLFLAHWHHVAYESHFGTPPPNPYVLDHVPGHVHFIAPPHWKNGEIVS